MKINWGTGLVIGMVLFIGFIMFFVITMTTDDKYSHDLVAEDYYKQEMQLQETIDAATNEARLETPVTGSKIEAGYALQFPETFDPKEITGKVFLYRPSGKQLDFDMLIALSNSTLLIPKRNRVTCCNRRGSFILCCDWNWQSS